MAQAPAPEGLQPGEAYVTRFSGTVVQDGRAVINVNGAVGSILDIRAPGGPPSSGQWLSAPQRFPVAASEIGQVFGVALDDANPPNVYLTATSAFGLHRAPDNAAWMAGMWGTGAGPGTVWKLTGANNYRPEVFARIELDGRANTGAALGNVAFDRWNQQLYVSDLETGMIHRLSLVNGADLGHYDHGTQGRPRFVNVATGASQSLPAVAFDRNSRARIDDCAAGTFAQHPSCWNLADFRRRVWGLGVRRDEATGTVRLYYSVWGSQGFGDPAWFTAGDDQRNSVWSVHIGPDGAFDASDVRREFALPNLFSDPAQIASLGASHPVSDIAFPKLAKQTVMLVAERGGMRNLGLEAADPFARPHESRVLRYQLDANGTWQPGGRYDVGYYDRKNDGQPYLRANASGGVDFGMGYGTIGHADGNAPDQFAWMTGDSLCSPAGPCVNPAGQATEIAPLHGIQGTPVGASGEVAPRAALQSFPATGYATPADTPRASYMLDALTVSEPARGDATLIGDVAIYQPQPVTAVAAAMPAPGYVPPPGYLPPLGPPLPPGGPGFQGGPGGGPGFPGGPGWWGIPLPNAAALDLQLTKEPPGQCTPNITCQFRITIANNGPGAYVGPLFINDVLPKGWKLASATAPWNCQQQGDVFVCGHAQTALAPGQSVAVQVNVFPNPASQPGQVENCAQIDWKGGPGDVNQGNDRACAQTKVIVAPAAQLDLELTKAEVSAIGGDAAVIGEVPHACSPATACKFRVTITNNGPDAHTGPLNVKDTLPKGWKFAAATTPWTCQQQGDTLSCGHGQLTIAAGQSTTIELTLQAAPVPQGKPTQVENCAEIDWKGGAGDINKANDRGCAKTAVNPVPPDLWIYKSAPATCKRGANCTYTITIHNLKDKGRYQGPLVIEEQNFKDPGIHLSTYSPAPWQCKPDAIGKIRCQHPGLTLDPGQSTQLSVGVFLPGALNPVLDKLQDCALITVSTGDNNKTNDKSCAETALVPNFDLAAGKTGPAQCYSGEDCGFEIAAWSVGGQPYVGSIVLEHTSDYPNLKFNGWTPFGSDTEKSWNCGESSGKAAWTVPTVNCKYQNDWVVLAAADPMKGMTGYVSLKLFLTVPKSGPSQLKNCVRVHYKGILKDANPANDEICLTTPVVDKGGGVLIGGALKITGDGPATCTPGVDCSTYEFTISNDGPGVYSSPMTLRTKLPAGSTLRGTRGGKSAKACPAAGWSCQGVGDEQICQHATCRLDQRESTSVVFDLSLLPAGAPPPPAGTAKTICADLEWTAAAAKVDIEQLGSKRTSRACVTTRILAPKPGLTIPPSPLRCAGGKVPVDNRCVCPQGTIEQRGQCVRPPEPLRCTGGRVPVGNQCVCPQGTIDRGGQCVRPPEVRCTGGKMLVGNQCVCPQGTVDRGGQCVRPPEPLRCTGGKVPVGNQCVCPQGTVDRGGQCVRPPEPLRCTGGKVPVGNQCVCPQGTIDRGGQCVRPPEPLRCTGGKVPVGNQCVCPQGTVDAGGRCIRLQVIPGVQVICPAGQVWSEPNKRCLPQLR